MSERPQEDGPFAEHVRAGFERDADGNWSWRHAVLKGHALALGGNGSGSADKALRPRGLNPDCTRCGGSGFIIIEYDEEGYPEEDNCPCLEGLCDCGPCRKRREGPQ